jgi:RecA-family ATPase
MIDPIQARSKVQALIEGAYTIPANSPTALTVPEPPAWVNDGPPVESATVRATTPGWPVPLDLAVLATREPQPPKFIIDAWLPSGYATLFAAHGGSGKSTIALLQAVCIALGLPFAGMPTKRRRVLYLSCEDRESVLHWRLSRICAYLGVNMADLAGWLVVLDLVGHDSVLWITNPGSGASYTAAFGELAGRIKASGCQVIYVDGIADVYGGEENSRAHVKQFVNALVGLIDPDDGAIVLIGHVNKDTALVSTSTEGYSGSTGWHNSVRARWYLYHETEQDDDSRKPVRTGRLAMELQKSNLGESDECIAWRWNEPAHMFLPEEAQSNFDRVNQQIQERRGILLAMKACTDAGTYVPAATTGPRTAFHVLSVQSVFADSMRSGRASVRRFWREIEHLRSIRHIEDSSIRRADRKHTATLVLTTEGMRSCG